MDLVVFWIVAPISVISAIAMIVQTNAVRSALLLVVNLFTLAVFFVLLDAHFLAAVQVIVYAGAIVVLFLFVLMFLGVDRRESLRETIPGQRVLAVGLGALLIVGVVIAVNLGVGLTERPAPLPGAPGDNVGAVADTLFTTYVFPFEMTSILLIVAAIAAMVMAGRGARRGEGIARDAAPEGAPSTPGDEGAASSEDVAGDVREPVR